MKVIILSSYSEGDTSFFVHRALELLGVEVRILKQLKVSFSIKGFTLKNRIRHYLTTMIPPTTKYLQGMWEKKVLEAATDFKPDMIFVLKGDGVSQELIQKLRGACGCRIINWFPDSLINLKGGFDFNTIRLYDRFYVKDRYLVGELEKIGLDNIGFLPQAFDPDIHKKELFQDKKEESKYTCDLAVLGSNYPYRRMFLENLVEETDYDLKIWGAGWNFLKKDSQLRKHWMGEPVVGREKGLVFSGAKIVLNEHHFSEVLGVNKRTYETAGAGVFQLVGWLPGFNGLWEVFVPGEEIVCFDGMDELGENISCFLEDDLGREEIAGRACKRAHRDHTYLRRMEDIMEELG